jgi:hypothetical protein
MAAAHQNRWDVLMALAILNFVKTIGNRLHFCGILKQTSVQWPSRLADVHAIDVGDLTDLLRATPIDWAHAPEKNVPADAPVDGALEST